MSLAWKPASEHIQKAQVTQKKAYDKKAREADLRVGERVMVLMPSEVQGKDWKLARPFHGPYHVIQITPTNAKVLLIDQPQGESIFVAALDRVRRCYHIKEMKHGQDQRKGESVAQTMHLHWKPVLRRSHIKDRSLAQGAENWVTLDLLERLNSRMN